MNKKNFNIKLGTIFSVALSLLVAIIVWLIAKYNISTTGSVISLIDINKFMLK